MNNHSATTKNPFTQLVKFVANAFKSIFESENHSDFVRLKNFIAS